MRHTCEQIVQALAHDHGVTVTVIDLTERAGGFDNELFRAELVSPAVNPAHWPSSVIVRVAHRDAALPTVERVASVHNWCVSHDFPVPAALGCGSLGEHDAYFVMPFLKASPAIASLSRPWRWRPFITTFADIHVRLHDLPTSDFPGRAESIDDVLTEVIEVASKLPIAAPIVHWLLQHRAEAGTGDDRVVCHFDYHPFNLLWSWGHDPLVIDWDTAGVGPRAADVAFTAEYLALADMVVKPRLVGAVAGAVGRRLSRGYLDRYLAQRQVDPRALRYWRVFQTAMVLVWREGYTFMDTALRTDADSTWSPRLEAIVMRRFHALTSE